MGIIIRLLLKLTLNTMKTIKIAILCCLTLFIYACASTSPDPADMFPGKSANTLYVEGQNFMLKGHYNDAVSRFETFDVKYPFSQHAQQVVLDLIYSYYKQDDTASALATADRFIHLYPRSKNVDYAYYMRGLLNFNEGHGFFEKYFRVDFATRDLTALHSAYNDFNQLVRLFPRSKYAADARLRMIYIRNLFARHVLEVSKFYYKRQMYVASADRANEVILHYQQTPSIPEALSIMVKSYRKLGADTAANKTLSVLKLNFPDSKFAKGL